MEPDKTAFCVKIWRCSVLCGSHVHVPALDGSAVGLFCCCCCMIQWPVNTRMQQEILTLIRRELM